MSKITQAVRLEKIEQLLLRFVDEMKTLGKQQRDMAQVILDLVKVIGSDGLSENTIGSNNTSAEQVTQLLQTDNIIKEPETPEQVAQLLQTDNIIKELETPETD
jgi:hypothetical protein